MSGVLHGVIASLAGRVTDTFWKYVTLLLNTTSTNGAQNNTFLDSSTNNFTVTRNGDTTQGSFNPYMPSGYWSGYFDGTGDYLSVADNTALDLGSSDFCIEGFVYLNSLPASTARYAIAGKWGASANNLGYLAQIFNDSGTIKITFEYSTNGSAVAGTFTATATPTANTWNHIAFTRSGSTFRIFLNGVEVLSGTLSATIFDADSSLFIGSNSGTSNYINGYVSNLRIVKGTAVYTAGFTPPTTPLTAITNTSLLCLQDNRFIDNSTNAFAITVNGDTRISKFAPFNPPASYSAASYGGSGYFDGTGDYLTAPDNAAFDFGSGDFTVECWAYAAASPAQSALISKWNAGGTAASNQWLLYLATTTPNFIWSTDGTNIAGTATSPAIVLNTWNHIAAVRSGNTITVYTNGVAGTGQAVSGSLYALDTEVLALSYVRNNGATSFPYTGYISNARVVKGTAVYTAGFTPPTTPLTAITNTSLLLNFTNAGIYDAATINDGQTVGNAQVSSTQVKWSPTSMAFDGTGDYVTVIDKPELRLGTGDFTIEGWVYLTATGVAYGLVSKGAATTGWSVNVTSGNKLQFSYTATQLTGATSLASGTWYYFAVVRSGTASGNLKVYLNGSADATSAGAVNDDFNQTSTMYVGADRVAGAVLNGYLQDVRVTNGYARTIATPTAAFPTL
jgi:hypothetical protein